MSNKLTEGLAAVPDQLARERAIDPTGSFIVQAPAGSGKTALLVKRYIGLLAIVNEPEEILAITFTRKAAQEMRSRVLQALSQDDKPPNVQAALKRSADRKWNLIANPQRMRIQTIDSFQQGLVQQLPYQSQLSLDYETVENAGALYEEAVANVLERIRGRKERFGDEIAAMLAAFDNHINNFTKSLVGMLISRIQWLGYVSLVAAGELETVDPMAVVKPLEEARQSFCEARRREFIAKVNGTGKKDGEWWSKAKRLVERSKPGDYHKMTSASDWNHLANILTTATDFRKQITKRSRGLEKIANDLELKSFYFMPLMNSLPEALKYKDVLKIRDLPEADLGSIHRSDLTNFALTLLACVEELQEIFTMRRVVDFTERAIAARRALRVDDAPTQLAYALDYRIRHLLVDEYQDTSIAQNEFFNLLMEGWEPDDGNTFFAVGDPMQSIYMFRDADLTNFLTAASGGIANRDVEKLWLTANFRSSPHLVDFCNSVFESILGDVDDPDLGRVAFAKSEEMGDLDEDSEHLLVRVLSEDRAKEAELVAERVAELVRARRNESIALLFRTRNEIGTYIEAMRRRNVRWRGIEMEALTDVPVVRDLYSLTCALADPDDRQAWFELLLCPLAGIPLPDMNVLTKQERGIDMVLETDANNISLSRDAEEILKRVQPVVLSAMQSQHRSLRSRVERAWHQLGGANAYSVQAEDSATATTAIFDNAQHYLNELERLSTDTLDKDTLYSRLESIYATENDPNADVELLTIHKAKGLEFDHVVVPSLGQGTPPQDKPPLYAEQSRHGVLMAAYTAENPDPMYDVLRDQEKQRLENERSRLLYVAATRAKKTLSLYGTVKPDQKQSRAGTFLRLLEGAVAPKHWEVVEGDAEVSDELGDAQIWRRIDPAYRFEAPTNLPDIPAGALADVRPSEASFDQLRNGLATPLAIGLIVHGDLQRMVKVGSIATPSAERVEMWRNQLRTQGFGAREISEMLETIQAQLELVVSSEIGRWLLDATHDQSATEVAYTVANGASNEISIIDRTFVEDGVRWIVDYKTTRIPDDRDVSLDIKALVHQPQLVRYAEVFELQEDLPVKAAIFFTDVAELIKVDVSTEARKVLSETAREKGDPTFKRDTS